MRANKFAALNGRGLPFYFRSLPPVPLELSNPLVQFVNLCFEIFDVIGRSVGGSENLGNRIAHGGDEAGPEEEDDDQLSFSNSKRHRTSSRGGLGKLPTLESDRLSRIMARVPLQIDLGAIRWSAPILAKIVPDLGDSFFVLHFFVR